MSYLRLTVGISCLLLVAATGCGEPEQVPEPTLTSVKADHQSSSQQGAPDDQQPPGKQCPDSCDDGNPCTSDRCEQGACRNEFAAQPIRRAYNRTTGAHTFVLPQQAPPAGFHMEGIAFYTLPGQVQGSRATYLRNNSRDFFVTLDQNEGGGYVEAGQLGFAFDAPARGLEPVYRLIRTSLSYVLHLNSIDPNEGAACCQYRLEGTSFYTCKAPQAEPDPDPEPEPDPLRLAWSTAGPIAGQHCVQIIEPADPHTWADNYLCTAKDRSLKWSYAGPISGMHCVQVNEPADPYAWADNYLCAPSDLGLQWSHAGPIDGMRCLQINEPADPHTWADNFLCVPGLQ